MSGSQKPRRSWLKWAEHFDLSQRRGNGPMDHCLGVILHVNESEDGTSPEWFASGTDVNPSSVTPTFQVYKDGRTVQFLPLEWSPWCQVDGNWHYGAVETAGLHTEALTDAQLHACARIMAAYHRHLGVPLVVSDMPGHKGLGTHAMGGTSWGGHDCPGDVRAAQRPAILAAAREIVAAKAHPVPVPPPPPPPPPVPAPPPGHPHTVNVALVESGEGHLVGLERLLAGVPGYVPLAGRPGHHAAK